MKGFAMLGIGRVGWIDAPEPLCGARDAIIRPIAVAPCTSDIHTVWEGAIGERTNLILGHEAVGEVVEVGSEVTDFKPGDKVIVPAITPNWSSVEAQAGFSMHAGGMLGGWQFSNNKNGVFSEFFHVNDADGNLAFMPDCMDPAEAVMLSDMVTTGFLGAEQANIQFGDTVCVVGIGPVGLMAVAGAVLSGSGRIFAVGSRPNCTAVAKEFGANDIIDYHAGDIADQILDATSGRGVDRVIIAGGNNDAFIQAIRMVRPGGTVSNINYLGSGDFVKLPREEWGCGMSHKTVTGGLTPGGRRRMEQMCALFEAGRIKPGKLITHRFQGFGHAEEALLLMKNKPQDLIKPVVLI